MLLLWITLGLLIFLGAALFIISFICFRMAFYAPNRDPKDFGTTLVPEGEEYKPYGATIAAWAAETKAMPHREFSITSFDGLKLYGRYYECQKGAPIELMFHGYRGTALRDLAGGVQRCFSLGRNALIVDQRCSEKSEGNVISFGINERMDCLKWVDFTVDHFGKDVQIILTGISMGAATVLMAAGQPLPPNVIGVLADCGYNSPRDIIRKVIKEMGLPVGPSYFFVKLGARLYGHFDLEADSPQEALKRCTLPVIFYHGEDDRFVPCEMSRLNYQACPTRKMLVTVPGAGHGLSYPADPQRYLSTLREFFGDAPPQE